MWIALLIPSARGQIAPECADVPMPDDYDEQVQQDFLQNYYALSSTLSPVHGPIPHEPGHGTLGLEIAVLPPLGCPRRFVLSHTKTEDTNKSPVIPRPRGTVALPAIGKVVPYIGGAYVPPVPINGTVNVIVSLEAGLGVPFGEHFQLGGRFHATLHKTVGDVAGAFNPEDPPVDDFYLGSTVGLDVLAGYKIDWITPYAAIGLTDVSTFFLVGDDAFVGNNLHPYFGPALSLGADGLVKERLRLGGEFYAAPGGYSLPDATVDSVDGAARYGHIATARVRIGVEI
jgi:hypothetical protein